MELTKSQGRPMSGGALRQVKLCLYLTRMEFEKRFAGSIGGKLWIFVGPILTIGVIWTVIDLGLGMRAITGPQYGMSLAVGLCAWLFFSEGVNAAVGSITGSPHLVKKVVFPVVLLPVSSVMVAFVVHVVILCLIMFAMTLQGHRFGWSLLALPFWMFSLLLLAATTAVLLSGLNVVFRDTSAIAPNLIAFFFWLTPIIWPIRNLSETWWNVALINPVAVIIEGYRYTLLGDSGGPGAMGTAVFVLALCAFVFCAVMAFRRLRPWFANFL
jgi:ABC-type polysaccharide/polyol phosphate export permease